MGDLIRDEFYYMFVHDLALELTSEARSSFQMAGCDDEYQGHFLKDLADAITAEWRAENGREKE